MNKISIEIKRLLEQAASEGEDTAKQASQGLTAGMLLYHGKHGVLNIHMMQVTK